MTSCRILLTIMSILCGFLLTKSLHLADERDQAQRDQAISQQAAEQLMQTLDPR